MLPPKRVGSGPSVYENVVLPTRDKQTLPLPPSDEEDDSPPPSFTTPPPLPPRPTTHTKDDNVYSNIPDIPEKQPAEVPAKKAIEIELKPETESNRSPSTKPKGVTKQQSAATLPEFSGDPEDQRYFKVPYYRNTEEGRKMRGWWVAHFDGERIARQLQTHIERDPKFTIAGKLKQSYNI